MASKKGSSTAIRTLQPQITSNQEFIPDIVDIENDYIKAYYDYEACLTTIWSRSRKM